MAGRVPGLTPSRQAPVDALASQPALAFAVILPTLNESANIVAVITRIDAALAGIAWEAIFVDDDSTDGTADMLRAIARGDRRIRVVQRVGRRGLSSAVVEGMLATAAPIIAVMDADLQHDESVLPKLYRAIADDGQDVAIGTRYAAGGSTGDWDARRAWMSRVATNLAGIVIGTKVADPMSGLFAIRRDVLMEALPRLSNVGFKILLDLLASVRRPLTVVEVPYIFRSRIAGESKLDTRAVEEFIILLVAKLFGGVVPIRFLLFAMVGSLGLLVHVTVLGLVTQLGGARFEVGQTAAVLVAIAFNYTLNNKLTYRDMRLTGGAFVRGLASFYLVCLVGAVGNIGVGQMIYGMGQRWWLAGVAGAVVGVVWNYAVSSVFTWKHKR